MSFKYSPNYLDQAFRVPPLPIPKEGDIIQIGEQKVIVRSVIDDAVLVEPWNPLNMED